MTDVELLVRDALARHEAEVPAPAPLEVPPIVARTRRRQALNSIGVGLVVLMILLGAVTGVGALLRADARRPAIRPTPTPTPSTPAEIPTEAIYGLPPEGTPPSEPAVGELVIAFNEFCCPMRDVYVYADGRILSRTQTLDEATDAGGWVEQRLTSEGVELLRSELLSSGLFEADLAFTDRIEGLSISVRAGDRLVELTASSSEDPLGATDEEANAIAELVRTLRDPERRLPAEAWIAREGRAFIPARYTLGLDFVGIGLRTPDDPSQLPPPADDFLRDADHVDHGSSCTIISTQEARDISSELSSNHDFDAWGPRRERRNGAVAFVIVGGTAPGTFPGKGFVYLRPLLPHQVDCGP